MPLTKIWERYFLRELFKVFGLFLTTFYGLYALIDYSNHSSSFQNYHFTLWDIGKFYAYEFVTRMDILVPFAILIASIKMLCALNRHNELVALMASGIRLQRLLLPFIAFGLAFTGLIYINIEMLHPLAMKYHQQLDHTRTQAKQKKHRHPSIQQLALVDGSFLIFQHFDPVDEHFFDAYWVRSIDDIYRIRTLHLNSTLPFGKFVEHLERNSAGNLIITESLPEKMFTEMQFNKETILETVSSPSHQSLSSLKAKLKASDAALSEKEARLLTTYYYKLALPWLCLLAIIAPAPFCTKFGRGLPLFFIYALSIFGLFSFYLVMDAAMVLGERQLIAPGIAIWAPFTAFFAFFGWRFMRL